MEQKKDFQLSTFNFPFIRVGIIEGHNLVADGFERLVNDSENIRVMGKAYSAAGCMELLETAPCDVVLLDTGFPEIQDIKLCQQVKEKHPHIKVLMLSGYSNLFDIKRALDAGSDGYLIKTCTHDELLEGICKVASGIRFLCDEVHETIKKSERSPLKFSRLEMTVLQLTADGKSVKEQADKMCLSHHTVRNYHQRLNIKLNTHSKLQLVQKAKELKLV